MEKLISKYRLKIYKAMMIISIAEKLKENMYGEAIDKVIKSNVRKKEIYSNCLCNMLLKQQGL